MIARPLLLLLALLPASPVGADDFFETRIRPVLAEQCYSCHGPDKQKGDVRVDARAFLVADHDEGPLVVPGDPKKGRLLKALRHEGDVKMPPKSKLSAETLDHFAVWIKSGAPWPNSAAVVDPSKNHWAFQPIGAPVPPKVKNEAWPTMPIDRFILAALEAKGLTPNPAAERRTLLRRLKIDLLGLPPTFEEMDAFEKDDRPDAWARWVDRYLNAPQYGERWARHWLDVARYADNKGYVFTEERRFPFSYAYRDYVVRAFNDDMPFDRFILEQLAADRLVKLGQADAKSQAAMGYLTLGRRFLNNVHDIIDDRIDVVTRGLMGLTVTCARCHDHKYDPIPAKDYYGLYGVFASSSEPKELPLLGEPADTPEYAKYLKELGELESAVKKFEKENEAELKKNNREFTMKRGVLQKKVDAYKASSPAAPPRGMVLVDNAKPSEPRVLLRGNPNTPGAIVPRQFLGVLAGPGRKPFTDGSGRLEMARAIVSPDNPLTARVLVNRVWLHHFGAGLVTTPSDFGLRSDPPSHPELLDTLARNFMAEGWSIKKLHRVILLSQTYRQSSAENLQAKEIDPENRLLARANRRRFDFETMRDALLFTSGRLDAKMGGLPIDLLATPAIPRRTLYGFIDRQNLPGLFRTFDFANPDVSSPQRFQTTVPQQALFLLNSPFMLEQAQHLMKRLSESTVEGKIDALHRHAFARPATPAEIELGRRFVDASAGSWERYAQVLLMTNEFSFVD